MITCPRCRGTGRQRDQRWQRFSGPDRLSWHNIDCRLCEKQGLVELGGSG